MFRHSFSVVVKDYNELVKIVNGYFGNYETNDRFIIDLLSTPSRLLEEITIDAFCKYSTMNYPCKLEIELVRIKEGFVFHMGITFPITMEEDGREYDQDVVVYKTASVVQCGVYDVETDECVSPNRLVYNIKGLPIICNYLDSKITYLKHDINHISHNVLRKGLVLEDIEE